MTSASSNYNPLGKDVEEQNLIQLDNNGNYTGSDVKEDKT